MQKRCKKCGQEKDQAEFGSYKASPDGLRPWCRECMRVADAAYRAKPENKAKRANGIRQWREENQDHVKAYAAAYYEQKGRALRHEHYLKNKDRVNAQSRAWRKANLDKARETSRRSHAKYRDKLRAYERTRYETKREYFQAKNRQWCKANAERRSAAETKRRVLKKESMTGPIDYKAILARDGYVCHICGQTVTTETLSFDHVIPLSKGGPHTDDNIKVAHRRCNIQKGSKVIEGVV